MNKNSMSKVQKDGIVSQVAKMPGNPAGKQTGSNQGTIASVKQQLNPPMSAGNKPMKIKR